MTEALFDFDLPAGCPNDPVGAVAWTVIRAVALICADTGMDPQTPEVRHLALDLIGRIMWGAA
jgi:hypothetical protein